MKAYIYRKYGPPEVLTKADLPMPGVGPKDVRIRVIAAGVSTADWRMRSSSFPGGLWLIGRMMVGLFSPRNPVLGRDFAGVVDAVGRDVTRFKPGQSVFGVRPNGTYMEAITLPETGCIAPMPEGLSYAEAAALPFGANCSLEFLKQVAKIKAGSRVAVIGGSGGVGAYAVQIAAALGAEVTGVASAENHALMQDLGATHVVDYHTEDWRYKGPYNVVFETVGANRFDDASPALVPRGLFLPLNFGLGDLPTVLCPMLRRGKRVKLHVSGDTPDLLAEVAGMVADGHVRPVVDRIYQFDDIHAAHARVESRHKRGAVVLGVTEMAADRPAIPLPGPAQQQIRLNLSPNDASTAPASA